MNPRPRFAAADLPQLLGSVKVGERGQVVIPLEARTRMGIKPGEKLLAIGGLAGGAGLVLIKPETFSAAMADLMTKLNRVERFLRATERGNGAPARGPSGAAAVLKKTRRSRS
jgi:AbrB family looped-hinge helix DNA binding protein